MRINGFTTLIALVTLAGAATPGHAAGFGTVTAIAGQAADIALDEARGVVYIANFTASRIDVMSTATGAVQTSINVLPWPGSVALSPDAQYLLVTHYGSGTGTRPQDFSGITLIRLTDNTQQTFATGDAPLGVAFFNNQSSGPGKALLVTASAFYTIDPTNAVLTPLGTIANVSKTVPVPDPTWPSQVLQAALTTSGDRFTVWGIASAGTSSQFIFKFDSRNGAFTAIFYKTTPPLQPRVSVSTDGTYAMVGHLLLSTAYAPTWPFILVARDPSATDSPLSVTGHAIDSKNNLIYAQIPESSPTTSTSTTTTPTQTLTLWDADNLTVRDRILIPQSMKGRTVMNSAGSVLYSISDSGVMTLPVGSLNQQHRLVAGQEDLLVQTNFCNRSSLVQTLTITDPGGGHTDFAVTSSDPNVQVVPPTGTTPATVQVLINPAAFETRGTSTVTLALSSTSAINIPRPVRVLVNNPDVNQRGSVIDVPGVLSDIMPDSGRNRYYIIRQDLNQLMVFDGSSNQKITTLRTATTPNLMSLTNDQKYLVVGHNDSQLATVYDLDKMQQMPPVIMPYNHFAQSLASSNGDFLAVSRDEAASTGIMDIINMTVFNQPTPGLPFRTASTPPSLGVFQNDGGNVSGGAVLVASPNGSSVLMAEADGKVFLYSADNNTYQGRQDLPSLGGAYAASSYNSYVVGNNVFDASLVPIGTLDASTGNTAGFAFTGQGGYRVTAAAASSAGVIQNMPTLFGGLVKPTPMMEAPLLPGTSTPFRRTLAPLPSAGNVVALTVSGLTVLSANYDAATAPPAISKVVSAADGSSSVASGGLISIFGQQMSPVNVATSQVPLSTALGQLCLAVNGTPIPLLYVSGTQVNAQLPFGLTGNSTMSIHSPTGISNNLNFTINGTAPAIFMSGTAGPMTGLATVFKWNNGQIITPTNPVNFGDTLIIYLTGMGDVFPPVPAGQAAPMTQPFSGVNATPTVTLGGVQLNLLYAGLVPGSLSGLYQINATVPSGGVPQGLEIPLEISQGGGATTLNVRVVKQ